MASSTVGWKIVPNTVTSRMVDSSLIHKLIPSKRIRRRCKSMNIAIKRHHRHLENYNQYVKMKTAVLRNLSEDDDTDASDSFSEDDYSILHKSDLSLQNRTILTSNNNVNYFPSTKFSIGKSTTARSTAKKKATTQKMKRKCPKVTNLGWQDVVKNKDKSVVNSTNESNNLHAYSKGSQRMDDQRKIKNDFQIVNADKHAPINCNENSMIQESETFEGNETCTTEKVVELIAKVTDSNEIKHDISELAQVMDNSNELSEQINPIINDVNERLQSDVNYDDETSNSHEIQTVEGIKKNSTFLSDDTNKTKNDNNSFANTKVCQDERHSSSSEKDLTDQGTSADKNEVSSKLVKVQSSLIGSRNQPKDSGIEEDTEEEVLENRSKNHKKEKNKIQETQEKEQTVPLNQGNNSIIQTDLPTSNDDLLSKDCSASHDTNPKDTRIPLDKNTSINGDNKERMEKHKLQPVVTCTEIVNKKYKIISSCDVLSSGNRATSELNFNNFYGKKAIEIQEMEQTIEDTVSPLTKKRLQQLRRLNLTTESESGLSEDDNTCRNVENMRDNLLKRSRESLDTSNSEDESTKPKLSALIRFNKKLQENKDSRVENYNKGNTLRSDGKSRKRMKSKKGKKSKKRERKESIESLGFTGLKDKFIPKNSPEKDSNLPETHCQNGLSNFVEQITAWSDREESVPKAHSTIGENSFNRYEAEKESSNNNHPVESVMQASNEKKSILQDDRPCNLQELINKDGLVHQTGLPSFRFKDIHEDDIYILDIPSMAFEKNLLGKKMILTEKKLKLGKQKYKVEYKDIGNVSCIFGSRKSHKPYKTVNIKPITRVVAGQKIIKTPLLKATNQYVSD